MSIGRGPTAEYHVIEQSRGSSQGSVGPNSQADISQLTGVFIAGVART